MHNNDETVKGSLYLKNIHEILDNHYRIEKVLRRLTIPDGTKELFVRLKGRQDKYNLWIKETDKYDVVAK